MMCQHCNNAPCEPVCPVLATVHSSDGLNQQVYNRCVGTRYCENNCPYKVRRFNWFEYARNDRFDFNMNSPLGTWFSIRMSRSVLARHGEVQPVRAANSGRKLEAERDGRPVADGDIKTACQQACPADAIVFGDLADPNSRVARLSRKPDVATACSKSSAPGQRHVLDERSRTYERPRAADPCGSCAPIQLHRWIEGDPALSQITDDVARPLNASPGKGWCACFAAAFTALAVGIGCVWYQIVTGIGVWGLNKTVGWAFDITNFVFWVGIGHAGTLISAILLLLRQQWRTSINRSAEAMTIFAVMCAAMFPLIHMGRPWLRLLRAPIPELARPAVVNFRSPLLWDVFAINTYLTISLVFWYVA